jgi:seryl-tRNA synthetase
MLDPQLLRHHLKEVTEKLALRGFVVDQTRLAELEATRKQYQVETQELQSERNRSSKAIGKAKAAGEEITALLESVSKIGDQLKAREAQLEAIQAQLNDILMGMPNIPHESVPIGRSEEDNIEVRSWGTPPTFQFFHKDHVDLGADLGLLDFKPLRKLPAHVFR